MKTLSKNGNNQKGVAYDIFTHTTISVEKKPVILGKIIFYSDIDFSRKIKEIFKLAFSSTL